MNLSSLSFALGQAVIQFIWYGALIGALVALALAALRRATPNARYLTATAGMAVSLATFLVLLASALSDELPASGVFVAQAADLGRATGALSPQRAASMLWFAGAVFMALRFWVQTYSAHRLKSVGVTTPDDVWCERFEELKQRLGVARSVRLLESALAEVPMVVGWIRPVVLVPAAAFSGLSPRQIESLLAHELAHVRRLDHWINVAQAACEIVLFFHPVVWWVSRRMRVEREYCCDDSSVRQMGDPKLLAEALTAMEALRLSRTQPDTVLASHGGPLMKRITRIVGRAPAQRTRGGSWQLAAGVVLTGMLTVAGNAFADSFASADQDAPKERVASDEGKKKPAKQKGVKSSDARKEYKAVAEKLQKLVDAGELKPEEMKKKLVELRMKLAKKAKPSKVDKRMEEAAKWIQEALEKGEITKAEAEQKLAALDKRMAAKKLADQMAELEMVLARIQAAVAEGKLSPEEAKRKIEGVKQRIDLVKSKDVTAERFVGTEDAKVEAAAKAKWQQTQKRVESGIARGLLTKEQGQEILAKAKLELVEQSRLQQNIQKLDEMVAAGKLSKEEAQKKLAELKLRASSSRTAEQMQLDENLRRIEELVKAGKLSKEDAAKKIRELKRRRTDGDLAERQKRLARLAQELDAAVAAGKLSKEEARAKLNEARAKLERAKLEKEKAKLEKAKAKQKAKAKDKRKGSRR